MSVAANLGKIGENDADLNGDGAVNILDLVQVAGVIGAVRRLPPIRQRCRRLAPRKSKAGSLKHKD